MAHCSKLVGEPTRSPTKRSSSSGPTSPVQRENRRRPGPGHGARPRRRARRSARAPCRRAATRRSCRHSAGAGPRRPRPRTRARRRTPDDRRASSSSKRRRPAPDRRQLAQEGPGRRGLALGRGVDPGEGQLADGARPPARRGTRGAPRRRSRRPRQRRRRRPAGRLRGGGRRPPAGAGTGPRPCPPRRRGRGGRRPARRGGPTKTPWPNVPTGPAGPVELLAQDAQHPAPVGAGLDGVEAGQGLDHRPHLVEGVQLGLGPGAPAGGHGPATADQRVEHRRPATAPSPPRTGRPGGSASAAR